MAADNTIEFRIVSETRDAERGLDRVRGGLGGLLDRARSAAGGMMDIYAGIKIFGGALNAVKGFIDSTIGSVVEYTRQVKNMELITNAGTEATSRLIQVADDLTISQETLAMSLRFAVSKGIDVSISSLMRMSDEYRQIQDPVQKAQYAIDRFGARAGVEMAKMLEVGSDALRKMYDEVEDGLVVTEEAAAQARQLEIAQDKLEDATRSAAMTFGKYFLPAITELINAASKLFQVLNDGLGTLDLLANGAEKIGAEWEKNNKVFAEQAGNYDDYVRYSQEWAAAIQAQSGNLWNLNDALHIMTREEYDLHLAMVKVKDESYKVGDAYEGLIQRNQAIAAATQTVTESTASAMDDLKAKTERYHALLAGRWTQEAQRYGEKMETLKAKKEEIAEKIDELNAKKPWNYKSQVEDYYGQMKNIEDEIGNVQSAHERATRSMMLGWIETYLAADGLTDPEVGALTQLAKRWGLITDEEEKAMNAARRYAEYLNSPYVQQALANKQAMAASENIGDVSYIGTGNWTGQ